MVLRNLMLKNVNIKLKRENVNIFAKLKNPWYSLTKNKNINDNLMQ